LVNISFPQIVTNYLPVFEIIVSLPPRAARKRMRVSVLLRAPNERVKFVDCAPPYDCKTACVCATLDTGAAGDRLIVDDAQICVRNCKRLLPCACEDTGHECTLAVVWLMQHMKTLTTGSRRR
jgi:hypothetical protein